MKSMTFKVLDYYFTVSMLYLLTLSPATGYSTTFDFLKYLLAIHTCMF